MADKEATTETVSKADLDAAIDRARRFEAEAVDAKKKLDGFKHIDPVKYQAVIEENEILKKQGAGDDPKKWEQITADAVKKEREVFSGKLTEWETKAQKLESEVNHYKVVLPAQQTLSEKKILPEQMPLMGMLIEKELMLVDGTIKIKGPDGKPLRSKQNPANDMDVNEWSDGLVQKYPSAFASDAVAGSRIPGKTHTTTNGAMTVDKFRNMTPQQRSTLPREDQMRFSAQMLGLQDRQRVTLKTN